MMQLRKYQNEIAIKAVELLQTQKIAYLAMEVRTGKTLTALHAADNYGAKNVLFVTKLKAIASVRSDYEQLSPNYSLTTINFESAHKATGSFDLVIVDEAHSVGSFPKPSKRAKTLKEICKGLPIIYLSGTPTPESYSQMYHQLWISSFSVWAKYSNFYKWAKEYVDVQRVMRNGFLVNDYSRAIESKVKSDISGFVLSYTQKQAGFNQELQEMVLTVNMKAQTRKAIESLRNDNIANIGDIEVIADTPAKLLSKLHQLSSGTVIDEYGDYHIVDKSKAEYVKKEFAGKKIAIFYVFKSEFEMLKEMFPNWTASPEEFQASTNAVFLGQFRSAREGVRLDTAEALIFFNLEFSYLSYEQAKNRLQSKEREKKAMLYFIFSDCGVEQYVYEAVCGKMDFTLSYYGKANRT